MTELSSYYRFCRGDVLARVPPGVRDVLSVGCGGGFTERLLVANGARVTGVECDPRAAAVARSNGLRVLEGDASRVVLDLDEQFDCLIYADVLEHLGSPGAIIRSQVNLLRAGGIAIVSVPNFRHFATFWHLFVRGIIPYADCGIFDETHVWITTRKLVEAWLRRGGLCVEVVDYRLVRRRDRLLSLLTFGLLKEFLARQVIVVAKKPAP